MVCAVGCKAVFMVAAVCVRSHEVVAQVLFWSTQHSTRTALQVQHH